MDIEIRELSALETPAAAAVLGRGMRDNPLHVMAFGADPERREQAMTRLFTPVLRAQVGKGTVLGAFANGVLVGVCAMAPPGRCAPTGREKLSVLPALLRGGGPGGAMRALGWLGEWAKWDPATPHWHLGPVGVERHLQGQGVGSALLREFCRRVDTVQGAAYLETDKDVNVPFYQRFGFVTTAEADVRAVKNWFMMRAPGGRTQEEDAR